MDLQDGGAETSEPPPPAGKMSRTAFKLFVKRRSGSAMPSIFGVRSKGEARPSKGLPRSQTHDGLAAEAAAAAAAGTGTLESSKNGEVPPADPAPAGDSEEAKPANRSAPAAKSHGFFSLLRKSGRGEAAPQQPGKAAGSAAKQQRRGGLRGFLSGMQRWRRGSEPPPGEPEPLSASLTASMELMAQEPPEEPAPPAPEEDPRDAEDDESPLSSLHIEDIIQEAEGRAEEGLAPEELEEIPPLPLDEESGGPALEEEEVQAPPAPAHTLIRLAEPPSTSAELSERVGLLVADATSLKSFDSLTGCGDITAEPEEERPGEPRAEVEEDPPQPPPPAAAPEPEPAERPPTLLIYQGGGEEMASPEGVDDPELQDFWKAIPRAETHEPPTALEGHGPACPTDNRVSPVLPPSPAQDRLSPDVPPSPVDDRVSPDVLSSPAEDPSRPSKHPSTFGREDSSGYQYDEGVSMESFSGEALYDLSPDPKHIVQPKEYHTPVTTSKPLSPVATTCPLKATTGGAGKDSKIPISRKHLPVHPPSSQVTDPVQQPPSKSEIPRTKIPVSKVLVRRVSNKVITGSTYKSSALQDTAKK